MSFHSKLIGKQRDYDNFGTQICPINTREKYFFRNEKKNHQ